MQLENFKQLEQAIESADMILVGLGEEWVVDEAQMLKDLTEKNKLLYELYMLALKEERYHKLATLVTAYYYENYIPEAVEKAYRNLQIMLDGKNYFIVSLTVDSYLKKMGFKEDRVVNPCGTYEKLQCDSGCEKQLKDSAELLDDMKKIVENGEDIDCCGRIADQCLMLPDRYKCDVCGGESAFNLLDTKHYLEEGYLSQWQIYMKWLQGTLNKKLCVIEAGVGMKLPTVIRWPFEKTVFYNQKSSMIRIHERYYQINEEVADRAYGCKCHSVQLFKDKNVEA